jgi:excisionase family DNA binding protein
MRHGRRREGGAQQTPPVLAASKLRAIPFAERLTCTIAEACQVTGLGRTKLYELIEEGHLATTTIGRRRLVLVRSLQTLLEPSTSHATGQ